MLQRVSPRCFGDSKYASEQCTEATLMSISQFYMYFIIFKCGTEVQDFKLVCLEKPVLETALAALSNLRGGKINISNE